MAEERPQQVTTRTGDPAWLVTDYDTVKALLADPRLGRSHPDPDRAARSSLSAIVGQASSAETEQVQHEWMRKLLNPAFSARRMESLRPRVREMAGSLFDGLSRRTPPADFHEAVSFPLPVLVICELLGVPFEDREDFRRWSDDAANLSDGARSEAGMAELRAYMSTLLDRKRQEPAADVVSDLAAAQEQLPGGLTDEHVTTLAAALLWAGHETTVAAIDRGVLLLLQNRDQRLALGGDPALISGTVEEILRNTFPVEKQPDGVPRWTRVDVAVGGATIPAGDLVLLAMQSANLDRRVFDDPGVFDVTRQGNPHLTFGHGPHYCLGAPLARIELQVVFGTLFKRFPGLQLAVPVEQLRVRSDRLIRGLVELPVAW